MILPAAANLASLSSLAAFLRPWISAMLFLVFDIEIAFIYPWALIFKSLGLMGVIEMFIFIGILLVGFLYALKRGAFVWE